MFGKKRFLTGWNFYVSEIINLLIGFLAGIILFSSVAAVPFLTGDFKITGFNGFSWGLIGDIWLLLHSAFREEVVARLLIFGVFYRKFGFHTAAIVSSCMFTVFHLFNPQTSLFSTLGIFLAGLLFSGTIAYYSSLGLNTGIHWGWNVMQGIILGLPVSGITRLGQNRIYSGILQGNPLLTGEKFGLEASPEAIIILGILSLWLCRNVLRRESIDKQKIALFTTSFYKTKVE